MHNGAEYLRESIESCLAQTFRNWELIVVNDCSTDESGAIAEEYAAMDERIRVIHNETNLKLPASLNVGFRQAKGEYLTWTSDDNLYLPHALQRMIDFLREQPEYAMFATRTNPWMALTTSWLGNNSRLRIFSSKLSRTLSAEMCDFLCFMLLS